MSEETIAKEIAETLETEGLALAEGEVGAGLLASDIIANRIIEMANALGRQNPSWTRGDGSESWRVAINRVAWALKKGGQGDIPPAVRDALMRNIQIARGFLEPEERLSPRREPAPRTGTIGVGGGRTIPATRQEIEEADRALASGLAAAFGVSEAAAEPIEAGPALGWGGLGAEEAVRASRRGGQGGTLSREEEKSGEDTGLTGSEDLGVLLQGLLTSAESLRERVPTTSQKLKGLYGRFADAVKSGAQTVGNVATSVVRTKLREVTPDKWRNRLLDEDQIREGGRRAIDELFDGVADEVKDEQIELGEEARIKLERSVSESSSSSQEQKDQEREEIAEAYQAGRQRAQRVAEEADAENAEVFEDVVEGVNRGWGTLKKIRDTLITIGIGGSIVTVLGGALGDSGGGGRIEDPTNIPEDIPVPNPDDMDDPEQTNTLDPVLPVNSTVDMLPTFFHGSSDLVKQTRTEEVLNSLAFGGADYIQPYDLENPLVIGNLKQQALLWQEPLNRVNPKDVEDWTVELERTIRRELKIPETDVSIADEKFVSELVLAQNFNQPVSYETLNTDLVYDITKRGVVEEKPYREIFADPVITSNDIEQYRKWKLAQSAF